MVWDQCACGPHPVNSSNLVGILVAAKLLKDIVTYTPGGYVCVTRTLFQGYTFLDVFLDTPPRFMSPCGPWRRLIYSCVAGSKTGPKGGRGLYMGVIFQDESRVYCCIRRRFVMGCHNSLVRFVDH